MIEILLIVTLVILVGACAMCQSRRRQELPPSPPGSMCFGHTFRIDTGRMPHFLTELGQTYGPIVRLSIMGSKVISLSTSGAIKRAFGTPPAEDHLNDRSDNSSSAVFFNRKHIGLADNTIQTQRLRSFHKLDIHKYFDGNEFFEGAIRLEIRSLVYTLLTTSCEDFRPDSHFRRFYMNVCSILLTGQRVPDNQSDQWLLWDFVEALFHLLDPEIDGVLHLMPFLKFLPGKYRRAYERTIQCRDKVIKTIFEKQMETYKPGTVRGLIDVCWAKRNEETATTGSSWLTDSLMKGLMLDTLAAGMTEMTKTVRIFCLLMCHHPEVQSRMRREIDVVIGPTNYPSANHMARMPYTEAVVMETLRYSSQTALAIPHKANKDVQLDGYLIEKGSIIIPNLWGVHHDPEIWGDPWAYRPNRFLDNSGRLLPKDHPLMQNLIPFSHGARECPGQKFAMSRSFQCLTSLIQNLIILPAEKTPMPSADPRKYSTKYPLYEPEFHCRVIGRMPPT